MLCGDFFLPPPPLHIFLNSINRYTWVFFYSKTMSQTNRTYHETLRSLGLIREHERTLEPHHWMSTQGGGRGGRGGGGSPGNHIHCALNHGPLQSTKKKCSKHTSALKPTQFLLVHTQLNITAKPPSGAQMWMNSVGNSYFTG